MAEADAVKARGLAEAEALQRRVAALNEQNQAAILDKALSNLPEIAGHLSEAYSRIGNVTYVATGQGEGVTGRITQELVGMVPLLGAVFESATGLKLRDMIAAQQHAETRGIEAEAAQTEEAPAIADGTAVPEVSVVVPVSGNGSA
jgi:flotillin